MEEAPDSALDAACAALAETYTGEEARAERRTARERYVAGNEPTRAASSSPSTAHHGVQERAGRSRRCCE